MKPDAWMPLYGDDFIRGVKGRPLFVKWAYLLAVWHYWSDNHCQGLEDNEESLRDICEIRKDEEWEIARDTIFDNGKFFAQDANGRWHQKRAAKEWATSSEKYEKQVAKSKLGAVARWKAKHGKNATGNATGIPRRNA